ncbi:MAG TPA: DUF2934 domain-containing protein [Magnetospirillum sp.]|nr:DUF2934 domain-containing protein [Magnetospirillum sp.]
MPWNIAQRATGFGPVGYAAQADTVMNRIRTRVHALWEQAGRPQGRDAEFWQQAETEVVDEISLRD